MKNTEDGRLTAVVSGELVFGEVARCMIGADGGQVVGRERLVMKAA